MYVNIKYVIVLKLLTGSPWHWIWGVVCGKWILTKTMLSSLAVGWAGWRMQCILCIFSLYLVQSRLNCGTTLKNIPRAATWHRSLHLNTPALEYFNFRGYLIEDVVLGSFPNFKPVLKLQSFYPAWMGNFMGQLCNIRSMELWIFTAKVMETLRFSCSKSLSLFKLLNTQ